jgi:hypothetical protein
LTRSAHVGVVGCERHLHLPRARLEARVTAAGIELTTDAFARQVVLDAPGRDGVLFGDNHFDLAPGERRLVTVAAAVTHVRVQAYNADELEVSHHPAEAEPQSVIGRG